jgi:hypothetical protein
VPEKPAVVATLDVSLDVAADVEKGLVVVAELVTAVLVDNDAVLSDVITDDVSPVSVSDSEVAVDDVRE